MKDATKDATLKERLFAYQEESYRIFASALLPGVTAMIGIRLPVLRKFAKQMIREKSFKEAWENEPYYFEEKMLRGMLIGYRKDVTFAERLDLIAEFIPIIDNWSICDSFCAGLKCTKENKEQMWEFLQPFLYSEEEYEVRFAVVMLLTYYRDDTYLERVLAALSSIRQDSYYVQTAVAWAVSMCYVSNRERVTIYLAEGNLQEEVFQKAIQKICESRQVTDEEKANIKTFIKT